MWVDMMPGCPRDWNTDGLVLRRSEPLRIKADKLLIEADIYPFLQFSEDDCLTRNAKAEDYMR